MITKMIMIYHANTRLHRGPVVELKRKKKEKKRTEKPRK